MLRRLLPLILTITLAFSATETIASEAIIERLEGIVLRAPSQVAERTPGISVVGLEIPQEARLRKVLAESLGEPLTQGDLTLLRHKILRHFHAVHNHLVMVTLPEQKIADGIIEIVVTQSVLGEMKVKGGSWSRHAAIADMIQLTPGKPIDEEALIEQVGFVSRHPFREAEVIYAPGQEPLTTDIEVIIQDSKPVRIYLGSENTGLRQISRWRNFLGINWGNAFGIGDVFSFQFATAPNPKRFRAYTFNYTHLFATRQILQFFGGYSHACSEPLENIARTTGYSLQLSGRYDLPLSASQKWRQGLIFGADFKRMNSNLEFTTTDIADQHHNVNLMQALIGYTGSIERSKVQFEWAVDAVASPGGWLPDQKNSDYDALRPGAHAAYALSHFDLSVLVALPAQFQLLTSLRSQGTCCALLPSEQVGIGGHDSVRGYEEREFTADMGIITNVELKSPPVKLMRAKPKWHDALHVLIFFDHGAGRNHRALPGLPKARYLMSAGPGMRYTIGTHFSLRFDVGFRLHDEPSASKLKTLPNFGIIALF